MKKYLLSLTLMLLFVASYAQEEDKKYHATDEQIANAIRKSEYLKNPELTKTFERMLDHQEQLGGVMLPGVKTSEQVAQEYVDKYMTELIIKKFEFNANSDEQLDDAEVLEFFDQLFEENSEQLTDALVQLFMEWAVEKYGIKYPKIEITPEQAQANLEKVTDGIYAVTKFKRAGHDDFEPFVTKKPCYIIVNKGKSYRMVTNNENYTNGTFEFEIEPIKIKTYNWDGTSFQNVFTCFDPTHEKIAYKTQKIEQLEPISTEFGQTFYSMIGSMESNGKKKKDDNRLFDAWKRVEGGSAKLYKVYGENYRILITDFSSDSTFSLKGQYQICEYTPDGSTIEGGSPCKIEWANNNTYLLKYKAGSKEYTEKWMREPLPKAMTVFVKDCMSGNGNVKQLPTDPNELLDVLDAMPNCQERWNGYFRVLKMPEANTPEGWILKVRALIPMSQMQKENEKKNEALKLATQADTLAEAHAADGTAESMWYAAKVCMNDESFLNFDEWEKQCETLEMELTYLDEFRRLSAENPDKWKNELAQFDNTYLRVASDLAECYVMCEQYKKCIFVGNKTLKMWDKTSEEFRNNTLQTRYNIQSAMLRAAQKTNNKQVFETCANDISAFLADVSAKFQKNEVSMDVDTRETMMFFCLSLMETYCLEGDLERSSEYALLGKTFYPADSCLIDYRYCLTLADARRYEEAYRLHTELLKNEEFVEIYMSDGTDEIAKKLEGHIQPKQETVITTETQTKKPEQQTQPEPQKDKVKNQAPTAKPQVKNNNNTETQKKSETKKKISNQLASVNEKLDKAQGTNRVKIKGYTASSTNTNQAKKDSKGRVALPVDNAKKAGVGIHFKF